MDVTTRRSALMWGFKMGECLLTLLAFTLASGALAMPPIGLSALLQPAAEAPVYTAFLLVTWHAVLTLRGAYASHRLESRRRELLHLLGCVTIALGPIAIGAMLIEPRYSNAHFVFKFWAWLSVLVVVERAVMRRLLWQLRGQGRNLRFVIVVGSGLRAQRIVRILKERAELGYRLLGCVDDIRPTDPALLPWLGPFDSLSKLLSEAVVDEVLIALPMQSAYRRIQDLVLRCEDQGTLVTMPTDFFTARLARTRIGQLGESPLLCLSSVPENDWRLSTKQAIDFVGALGLLLLLSPLMIGVAVALRFSCSGPAIFKQTRIGLNKRPFTLYKFRTMVMGAEAAQAALEFANEASGPVFKIRKDPRVTALGSLLRRTSIDELPQLWNVLRGDMSLVGPRPLPLRDVSGFQEHCHRRRFSVRPGITCLWQLSGRSNMSFERWMELDLQYIDQWSLKLDIGILLKTARVVLMREGAY